MQSTILETKKIRLRKFVASDYLAVYDFNANPEVQKHTGEAPLESIEEAKIIIESIWKSDYDKYGYGRYAAVHKEDNKVIGFAGLKFLPEFKETDIGYRFLPKYWGQGIATEVSKVLVEYAFETLKLDRIIGITMKENIASQKVLEKSGLHFYKIDEYDGDGGDHHWYELNKAQYLQQSK